MLAVDECTVGCVASKRGDPFGLGCAKAKDRDDREEEEDCLKEEEKTVDTPEEVRSEEEEDETVGGGGCRGSTDEDITFSATAFSCRVSRGSLVSLASFGSLRCLSLRLNNLLIPLILALLIKCAFG